MEFPQVKDESLKVNTKWLKTKIEDKNTLSPSNIRACFLSSHVYNIFYLTKKNIHFQLLTKKISNASYNLHTLINVVRHLYDDNMLLSKSYLLSISKTC